MSHRAIPSELKSLLSDLKKGLLELYGERLHQVILFGSYARGEQREESDVDVLVVLNDEKIHPLTEISNMSVINSDLGLKYDKWISTIPVVKTRFSSLKLPLYENVREDGIEL
ncbi:nucleotidyltransferase family protein [Runella salmonicolor]|uniref:Nucleotidyltransferase domain-containing protein n=1 Tax=Runella salmonicolor TaxID=2950278 RepID=A0ABT1FLG3_9BACT|nr:nucleotidyltransferase domain-containing protein [Runella salmonicolor]MCP1381362.1 nucleotidyltransferase domain-containing protein [Runella salmonicolor]